MCLSLFTNFHGRSQKYTMTKREVCEYKGALLSPSTTIQPIDHLWSQNCKSALGPHTTHLLVRTFDLSIRYQCTQYGLMEELTLRSSDMGQPSLPIELWEIILESATACAEEWEFGHWHRSKVLCFSSSILNPGFNPWEKVLKTRRSLVAVSRVFNQLTTPLLYQSFFAITLGQVSRFKRTLQTRRALGGHVKRLSLSAHFESCGNTDSPLILGFCPNAIFFDTELGLSGLSLASPSLRSLELFCSPLVKDKFPYLLAGILQATPQLEHLAVYQLPFLVKKAYNHSLASIRLESLRALHLQVDSGGPRVSPRRILTAQLFFSLTLPRLEDLLLQGTDKRGESLDCIPASWLQHVRQINLNHESIIYCSLEPSHFPMLRKFTLYFSPTTSDPRGELPEKLPFIQLEEIELRHCAVPVIFQDLASIETLFLVLRLCADDTATPMLISLFTDVTAVMDLVGRKLISPQIVKKQLSQLESIVERILVRGIDLKGYDSSSVHSIFQETIKLKRSEAKGIRHKLR